MEVVYAQERLLLLQIVGVALCLAIAISVCLGILVGWTKRTSRRLLAEAIQLRVAAVADKARINDLDKEVRREHEIRRRTELRCTELNADLAMFRDLLEHVDV